MALLKLTTAVPDCKCNLSASTGWCN